MLGLDLIEIHTDRHDMRVAFTLQTVSLLHDFTLTPMIGSLLSAKTLLRCILCHFSILPCLRSHTLRRLLTHSLCHEVDTDDEYSPFLIAACRLLRGMIRDLDIVTML